MLSCTIKQYLRFATGLSQIYCSEDDFERKWKELTRERDELILEGIVYTAGAGPDIENCRTGCPSYHGVPARIPEITIPCLSADCRQWPWLPGIVRKDVSKPIVHLYSIHLKAS
ncbi:hypothetical protein K439DRAFT_632424 [Ramaria rubella]|nr:hypothetical protein K439DRAFT_632424 [Ramaria rubella]